VRGHKGAVLIESKPGKGTSVRVLLPVMESCLQQDAARLDATELAVEQDASQAAQVQPADAQPGVEQDTSQQGEAQPCLRQDASQPCQEQDASQPAETASGQPEPVQLGLPGSLSGTVLVVDDEQMVCDLCAATLAGAGLQVLTAADGMDAVVSFREHADEIGCVLLDLTMPLMDGATTLELLRQIRPDVPIILSSGYDEQEATRRFAGRGLAGFLQKPYELKALKAELQRVLQ
jgi:CheY-like chemotaxis protein